MCVVMLVGELDLGDLRCFEQPRRGLAVAAHVDAGIRLEAVGQMLENALVHVGAAELGIAAGGS